MTVAAGIAWCVNHTGTPRVPSDALPPPARVPGTHRSLHSATLALTVRVCSACHALLLRQCPDGTCTHPRRCVECTPRSGGEHPGHMDLRSCENHTSSWAGVCWSSVRRVRMRCVCVTRAVGVYRRALKESCWLPAYSVRRSSTRVGRQNVRGLLHYWSAVPRACTECSHAYVLLKCLVRSCCSWRGRRQPSHGAQWHGSRRLAGSGCLGSGMQATRLAR